MINFFAALNAAVASDGTFIYVPKGVRCPMELSTYFRINAEKLGSLSAPFWWPTKNSYVSSLKAVPLRLRDGYQVARGSGGSHHP